MGRKKANRPWEEPAKPVTPTDWFDTQIGDRKRALGRTDTVIEDQERAAAIIIGCPLEAISLRYLFVNDVFPYSRMTELIGRSESCKTAFLFEVYRWHVFNRTATGITLPGCSGGYAHHLAEPRDSPDLRGSIVGHDYAARFQPTPCECLEDWQVGCTNWVKSAENSFQVRHVCGMPYGTMPMPMCLGVDSLTAVTTRDEMNKTWEQGYADPGFAQIAKSINLWLKVFPAKMATWPVSFVGVNHVKEGKDNRGFITRNIPGGAALDYTSTFKMRFELREDIEKLDECARLVKITGDKNSLSTAGGRRTIKVRMRWTFDDSGVQVTLWDWHDATVDLLLSFDGARKKRIMDVVPIESVDKTRRTATCLLLGLTKASFSDIGAAIMEEADIVAELDKMFGVRKRRPFVMGVPYAQQVEEAAAAEDSDTTQETAEFAAEESKED